MKKFILILSLLIGAGISQASPTFKPIKAAPDSVYICVSTTGHKYHNDRECRGLAKCTHEIRKVSKVQAIKMGYTPCKICYR